MHTFADRVTRVEIESAALTHYLHALPLAAWEHLSACARWVIGDVVAHLVDSGAFYTESITRGLHGERTPFANRPPAGSVNGASVAALTATRVLAARQRLGERLLTAFDDTTDRFNHLVTRLSAAEAETACYHPGNLLSVWTFVGLRLLELVVHGWDIRSRFAMPAPLSTESVPVLLARIPRMLEWPGIGILRLDAGAPRSVRYRFALTGAAPGMYDILVENDMARIVPVSQATPHVTFHCATDIFVLLMYRRLTLEPSMRAGHLAVEGDQELTAAFDRWLRRA